MKKLNAILLTLLVLIGAAVSTAAFAHGGRHFSHRHARLGIGLSIGAPVFYSPWYYYPAPYYYYPPAVVVPSSPPVYIERGQVEAPAPDPQAYWYYCRESETYYPYVKECAGPWQRVVPHAPPS